MIYDIVKYKLEECTEKVKEVFVGFVTDYERTGSIDKFIAVEKDVLTKEKLSKLEDIAREMHASRITYIDPYEGKKETLH